MNKFTINGNEYVAKPFDFNMVCDLEDMGISMDEMQKKPTSVIRAYFGVCAGITKEAAGKEVEAHIIGGENLEKLMGVMSDEMEKSDFFRSLAQTTEKETAEDTKETGKKK